MFYINTSSLYLCIICLISILGLHAKTQPSTDTDNWDIA